MANELFRYRQFSIQQDHAAMKVGTDSDLLGALAGVPESDGPIRVLDIGTGTGVLSLMMAQRYPNAVITAIEIDENAVIDAERNFAQSTFGRRITLHHQSFQDYLSIQKENPEPERYDCIICNPPYFDKSLECDTLSKTRARHSSSLPFRTLIEGAYYLLKDGGLFSVCIPPEVLTDFTSECIVTGFWLKDNYKVKSVPEKAPKRFVLVHQKGGFINTREHICCMRNSDRSRSEWYEQLMKPFHLNSHTSS